MGGGGIGFSFAMDLELVRSAEALWISRGSSVFDPEVLWLVRSRS